MLRGYKILFLVLLCLSPELEEYAVFCLLERIKKHQCDYRGR